MKSRLSLFGVGLKGLHQLALMRHTFTPSIIFSGLSVECLSFMYLLNLDTGYLMDADNMPVSIGPGYFKQGKHDRFGDTELSQAKIEGMILPKEVSTTLGASLPIAPLTRNTGYILMNYTGTQTRRYACNNPSPVAGPLVKRWHTLDCVFSDASTGVSGTLTRKHTGKGVHTIMHYVSSNGLNEMHFDIWQTGRWNYIKNIGGSGFAPDFSAGSYEVWYRTGGGSRNYLRSSATSGMTIEFFTPPVSLSNISTELILTSVGDGSSGNLIRDLRSLACLERGNAPWLSCYYAVESLKLTKVATPESLRDTSQIMQLLPPLSAFAKSVNLRSPSQAMKAWAQVYLWFIYGILPTIGDAKALSAACQVAWNTSMVELTKQFAALHTKYGTVYDRQQVLRGYKVTYQCNARVSLRPRLQSSDRIAVFMTMLKLFNIELNMANIWELIPYSFVVDWFANTGRFAKFVDYNTYPTTFNVDNINLSHKFYVDVPVSSYFPNQTGLARLTTYDREIHYQFPVEPFDLRFTDPSGHWLEGIALLVSRR